MSRRFTIELIKWSDDPKRKTLILCGEGQSGKIRAVRKLASETNRELIIIDLANPEFSRICKENAPKEMTAALASAAGKEISGNRSILYLDSLEKCPELIPELKNIHMENPELPLIVTGNGIDNLLKKYEADLPAGRFTYLLYTPFSLNDIIREITPGSGYRDR